MKLRLMVLLGMFCPAVFSFAKTVIVYVYNTEFSIYHPSEKKPVTAAIINAGDIIRWQWVQGGHTTTAEAGSLEQWNQVIDIDNQVYERQFNNPGIFPYYCIPHASNMRSTITVLAAGSGACCLPDGSCVTTDQGTCTAQGGVFKGNGTLCDTINCTQSKTLQALKDNTLYQSADGTISNGKGTHFFAGRANQGIRRGVLAFDLSSIPQHAIIQSVQLKLYCNNNAGTDLVGLHRALKSWGEGNSTAGGQETNGTTAQSGDATWLHRFYSDSLWTSQGGDYVSTASASTQVNNIGLVSWTSMQLTHDVQHWVENPVMNYGWLIKCSNEGSTEILKRFSSLQNGTAANRPTLVIEYIVPPLGACCLPDGSCNPLSEVQCQAQGGQWAGAGVNCNDINCTISLTPYVDPLPVPAVVAPVSGMQGGEAHYVIKMTEQFQKLHRDLPPTRTWGYNGPTPGPVIVAFRGKPVTVDWVNDLRVAETNQLRTTHPMFVDTCLHGPHITKQKPVTVVHLHGAKVSQQSDGHPDSTFLPGQQSSTYHYPNDQPAATMWYHDHALGITRLNVMMGLAGLYILRDSTEQQFALPRDQYDIPLVIQDKSLAADGTMIYPEKAEQHFFGNQMLVNGKVWPYLDVKKGKYRFRLVNGCNSRALTLSLSNHNMFQVIGTELGLLRQPVPVHELTMLPGERYEVIIDFAAYASGTEIILSNSAPAPFPGFPGVGVIPNVMKFIVQAQTGFTQPIPSTLASFNDISESESNATRDFKLYAIELPSCEDHEGHGSNDGHTLSTHPVWTINGRLWDDITEHPIEGSTEIWRWENTSGIDHPMHLHLVMTRVLDRTPIDANGNPTGPTMQPLASEAGWKDTWNCPTGYRTRTIARFSGFTGQYPYHCHILEHEDHEMMRQFRVVSCKLVSSLQDSGPGSLRYALDCAQPGDTIRFDSSLNGKNIVINEALTLSKNVTIISEGDNPVWIDAQNAINAIIVSPGVQASIHNLNIRAGTGVTGRGIFNLGNLVLENIVLLDPGANNNSLYSGPGSSLTVKEKLDLKAAQ